MPGLQELPPPPSRAGPRLMGSSLFQFTANHTVVFHTVSLTLHWLCLDFLRLKNSISEISDIDIDINIRNTHIPSVQNWPTLTTGAALTPLRPHIVTPDPSVLAGSEVTTHARPLHLPPPSPGSPLPPGSPVSSPPHHKLVHSSLGRNWTPLLQFLPLLIYFSS